MEKFTAKILSYILHPLLLPTYTIIFIFLLPTYLQVFPFVFKRAMVVIFFILTFIAPALALLVLYNIGAIKNLNMNSANERKLPLAITSAFYVSTYIIFQLFPYKMPDPIVSLTLVSAIAVTAAFFINLAYKISAHTIGTGSIIGYLLVFFYNSNTGSSIILIILITILGLSAFARLKENSHNPFQIYTGFLVGFIVGFSSFFM